MDPLADLVAWVTLYGIVGLFSIGLAERFVPVLPSYGVLVAIGIAADQGSWSIHAAVISTTAGSFIGALSFYVLVRAFGKQKSASLLYAIGRWGGLSRQRIDLAVFSMRRRGRLIITISQLIPTVRLFAPLASGMLGTSIIKFASGLALGIVLWNGVFITTGYLVGALMPEVNASALALKTLLLLIAIEAAVALMVKLQRRQPKRLVQEGNLR